MRFTRDVKGLARIKTQYAKTLKKPFFASFPKNNEESEDTKVRKNIHKIILEKIGEEKSNIEIEIYLRNMYPDYAEYIAKMINDQFIKMGLNKKEEVSDKETGDER